MAGAPKKSYCFCNIFQSRKLARPKSLRQIFFLKGSRVKAKSLTKAGQEDVPWDFGPLSLRRDNHLKFGGFYQSEREQIFSLPRKWFVLT